jgi:hypothetical protein
MVSHFCFIVFHCVSLCFIVFHCVSLCFVVFHGFALCFIVFHCVSMCFIVVRGVSLCLIVFHCVPLCFIVLHDSLSMVHDSIHCPPRFLPHTHPQDSFSMTPPPRCSFTDCFPYVFIFQNNCLGSHARATYRIYKSIARGHLNTCCCKCDVVVGVWIYCVLFLYSFL